MVGCIEMLLMVTTLHISTIWSILWPCVPFGTKENYVYTRRPKYTLSVCKQSTKYIDQSIYIYCCKYVGAILSYNQAKYSYYLLLDINT